MIVPDSPLGQPDQRGVVVPHRHLHRHLRQHPAHLTRRLQLRQHPHDVLTLEHLGPIDRPIPNSSTQPIQLQLLLARRWRHIGRPIQHPYFALSIFLQPLVRPKQRRPVLDQLNLIPRQHRLPPPPSQLISHTPQPTQLRIKLIQRIDNRTTPSAHTLVPI